MRETIAVMLVRLARQIAPNSSALTHAVGDLFMQNINDLIAQVTALEAANTAGQTRIAALEAENAALKASAVDPTLIDQAATRLAAVTASIAAEAPTDPTAPATPPAPDPGETPVP